MTPPCKSSHVRTLAEPHNLLDSRCATALATPCCATMQLCKRLSAPALRRHQITRAVTNGCDAASVGDDAETGSAHSGSEAMSATTHGSHSDAAAEAARPKRAAVAMAVGAGSFSDPQDMQGLSHYLEHVRTPCLTRCTPSISSNRPACLSHCAWSRRKGVFCFCVQMLFMGSKAFPGENEYDDFLVKHAGSSNAYTEAEYTNFHFDVEPGALRPALERFSAFFREPLFLDSALEREVRQAPAIPGRWSSWRV